MKYISTRNNEIIVDSYEAILKGLAPDGGLFVPVKINAFTDISLLRKLSYQDLAMEVMSKIFDDIGKDELRSCIDGAYDDKFDSLDITPVIKSGDYYFLELYHGPTSAFKDVALTFLPRVLKIANDKKGDGKKVAIITATSGDTGKAALEGFRDVEGTLIKVLYPYKMVSKIQERQMSTTLGNNVEVLAVKGNFDDCQIMAKELLENFDGQNIHLSSANSINIGRLIPQIVYYFKAYFDLLNKKEISDDEKIDFVVPTGNFGDILAGYFAKKMGLPIGKLVCASNENNVLTNFMETGIYDANRKLYNTMSPSIDILVSSNFERLLYYASKDTNKVNKYMSGLKKDRLFKVDEEILEEIKKDFVGIYSTQDEAKATIKNHYDNYSYLIDTHTAVALACASKYNSENKKVVLSTASPFKFSKDVYFALNGKEIEDNLEAMDSLSSYTGLDVPCNLNKLKSLPIRFEEVIETSDMNILVKKLETEK